MLAYIPAPWILWQMLAQGAQGAQDPATGRHLPLLRARRCLALGPGAPGAPGGDAASAQRGSWAAGRLGEGDPGEFSGQILMGFCWDFELKIKMK